MMIRAFDFLVVHHSASPTDTSVAAIRDWHLDRGFDDIGYHFIFDRFGIKHPGRPLPIAGAHTKGYNTRSIGVCLIGDNTRTDRLWSQDQVGSLQRFFHGCQLIFPGIEVVGHRDLVDTLCPGLDVRKLILGPTARPLKAA